MQKIIFLLTLIALSPDLLRADHHRDDLYAGAASIDITPPIGAPLGGYGGTERRLKTFVDWFGQHKYTTFFKPSVGVIDPIRSKVFILKKDGKTLLFISLDVVGVTSDIYEELRAKLKPLGFDSIFISATHTHSGPGALSKSWFWELVAMDKFNKKIYQGFINGILTSIEKAYAMMEPADLYAVSFEVPQLHHNRRPNQDKVDHQANLLLARSRKACDSDNSRKACDSDNSRKACDSDNSRKACDSNSSQDGKWLGGIVNYAIHGIALDENNLSFSADIPGGIERELETALAIEANATGTAITSTPTLLFINGAEGDVTPVFYDQDGIKKTAELFREKALTNLPLARKLNPQSSWNFQEMKIEMPRGRLNTLKCNIKIKNQDIHTQIPLGKKALPRMAYVFQLELDGIMMMAWPGEPTTAVGFNSKAIARKYGHNDPWILGLTNGHLGYFTTDDEYQTGGYEACFTFHGPCAAQKILDAHEKIISN